MKIPFLTINRWLWRLSLVPVLIMVVLLAMPFWQIYGQSTQDLPIPQPLAMASAPTAELSDGLDMRRNFFDPAGQAWQGTGIRRTKSMAGGGQDKNGVGEINGLINIHEVQGLLVGNKFVPVGGAVSGGNLGSLHDGHAVINSSQGSTEIDINQQRTQRRQKLNIQIK